MFVWMKKIGQVALLLVVMLALIGVNVKQVYCCHAHDLHREVIFVPDEAAETCHEGCCGSRACHHTTRYDFYKVTDYSQVETDTELFIFSFNISGACFSSYSCNKKIWFLYQSHLPAVYNPLQALY
jgi:hypothetical protein